MTVCVIFYKMYITMRRPANKKQNFSFIPPVPVTNGPKTIICPQQQQKKNIYVLYIFFFLNNIPVHAFFFLTFIVPLAYTLKQMPDTIP